MIFKIHVNADWYADPLNAVGMIIDARKTDGLGCLQMSPDVLFLLCISLDSECKSIYLV